MQLEALRAINRYLLVPSPKQGRALPGAEEPGKAGEKGVPSSPQTPPLRPHRVPLSSQLPVLRGKRFTVLRAAPHKNGVCSCWDSTDPSQVP